MMISEIWVTSYLIAMLMMIFDEESRRKIYVKSYLMLMLMTIFVFIFRKYRTSGMCPLVFIMSDSNTDNFVHSLFPKKLQNELGISNIS